MAGFPRRNTVCVSYTLRVAIVAAAIALSGTMAHAMVMATGAIKNPIVPEPEPLHLRFLLSGNSTTEDYRAAGWIICFTIPPKTVEWHEHPSHFDIEIPAPEISIDNDNH